MISLLSPFRATFRRAASFATCWSFLVPVLGEGSANALQQATTFAGLTARVLTFGASPFEVVAGTSKTTYLPF